MHLRRPQYSGYVLVTYIQLRLCVLASGGSPLAVLMAQEHNAVNKAADTHTCDTLELVTRKEWGARPPKQVTHIPPTNMTFLHHSAMGECTDEDTCVQRVKEIQDFHMDVRGWDDIGYNFLVGGDGRVYEGRGWLVQGAQAPTYNAVSHGICILGDYMTHLPTPAAMTSAKNLMCCGVEKGYIKPDYELFGHRDGRCTDCPGDTLYKNLQTWPHYSRRKIPIYCPTKAN